jgi:GPH family glycoside/pentoside/hexuronide:cation symporter
MGEPAPLAPAPAPSQAAEPLPQRRRVLYALGSTGFNLAERIIVTVAIFFYLPPEGSGLVPQVSEEVFWGGATAFGVAMMVGRLFDMFADPFVGHASDRSRSRLGRRRVFLLAGLVPMAALPALLFWPPGPPGSDANFVWLAAVLALYYVAFTVYAAPYLALIPELAIGHDERVRLTTLIAAVTFPVVILSGAWTVGFDAAKAAGVSAETAIRAVVVVMAVLCLLLSALPILAVDERRFARSVPSELPILRAMGTTLVNRPFLIYLFAQIFFIIGVNMIQPALAYFPRVVLHRSESFAFVLGLVLAVATAGGFPVVSLLGRRIGAKRTLVTCVAVFAVALSSLGALRPADPGTPQDAWNLALVVAVMLACGVPVAGFLVMPHVIVSQLVDRDERLTGANRAAMFFGMQGFCTKFMYGVSTAILAFLFARFGNSAAEPLGVLLVGPVAGVLCLASALLYALYPEREVLAAAGRSPAESHAGPPS